MVVASEDSASGEGDAFRHRHFDVSGEDDDVGPFPQSADSEDGVVRFVAEDRRFSCHDEDDGASVGHDGERFVSGVEDERLHGVPFLPAWSVGCWGVSISVSDRGHKKGTVLQTVPCCGLAVSPHHDARTYRVFPREFSG